MTRRSVAGRDLPLGGIRVLVTRPKEDAGTLQATLQSLGAQVISLPTISIRPTTDSERVGSVLDRLVIFDWVVFTSRNAVRVVFTRLEAHDGSALRTVKVAAVGPATADELRTWNVTPDCVPAEASGQALAAALAEVGISGASVLLPLGDLAGEQLRHDLESAGAHVTAVQVYETASAQPTDTAALEALLAGTIDVVALASPSAFRNLANLPADGIGDALQRAQLVAIGPTTAAAIRAAGFEPDAVAAQHTTDGLVEAIVGLYETEEE
jgi:uroporphyrinogen III methyltransferase / synthase